MGDFDWFTAAMLTLFALFAILFGRGGWRHCYRTTDDGPRVWSWPRALLGLPIAVVGAFFFLVFVVYGLAMYFPGLAELAG